MTDTMEFGQVIADWLATEGPTNLAPELVDVALSRARHLKQRRGLALALAGSAPWPSTRRLRAFQIVRPRARIAILVALTLAALLGLAILGAGMWHSTQPPLPQRLAFISGGDVYVLRLDGTGAQRIAHGPTLQASIKEVAWSPGGTHLAIGMGTGSERSLATPIDEIEVTEDDGRHLRRFATQSRFGWADENHLVAAANNDCCWNGVRLLSLDGVSIPDVAVQAITQQGTARAFGRRPGMGFVVALQDGYMRHPADGGREWGIDPSLTARIYLVSADGSRVEQVGIVHGYTGAGAISHDGRWAAFLFDDSWTPPTGPACPNGSPCLAIVALDSSGGGCTVPLGSLGVGPSLAENAVAWSPGDDRIALVYPAEVRSAVAIVSATSCSLLGSPVTSASARAGNASLPTLAAPIAWSADGRFLVFRATDPSTREWSIRRIAVDSDAPGVDLAHNADWFDLSDG
jgi:hypothetical protein